MYYAYGMKKLLGWGVGLLALVAMVSGSSFDNKQTNDQPDHLVQPITQSVQREKPSSETPSPQVEAEPTYIAPIVKTEPEPETEQSNCDPNYNPCVPNVSYDLDCSDISFSVTVTGRDHHRFDGDGDGAGCESN